MGRRIERIADPDLPRHVEQLADKGVTDPAMHKQAGPGVAILSGPGEDTEEGSPHSSVDIGVFADNIRGFAAEFQRNLGKIVNGSAQNRLPGRHLAGESHLVDPGMARQCRAGGMAETRQDIDNAVG